jgi:DNA polymerase-3 subunit alpha
VLNDAENRDKYPEKSRVTVAGMIGNVVIKNTKNGEKMAFFILEDKYSSVECLVFPKVYESTNPIIRVDSAVSVRGTVSTKDDEVKILVNSVEELIEDHDFKEVKLKTAELSPSEKGIPQNVTPHKGLPFALHEGGKLFVRVPSLDGSVCDKVKNLIELFDGRTQVVFYDTEKAVYSSYSTRFDLTPFTYAEIKELLGEENVIYH